MNFVNFWKIQTLELSITERMFFRDAVCTLQTWEIVKKYAELELIKKILETEINIIPANSLDQEANKKRGNLQDAECIVPQEK